MRNKVELVFYKGNWYHPNFFKRRKTCLKRAGYACQHCGKKQGDAYITNKGRESKIVLQAHHVNGDRTNPRAALVALCKSCHMIADAPLHRRTRHRKERDTQIAVGQLTGKWFEKGGLSVRYR